MQELGDLDPLQALTLTSFVGFKYLQPCFGILVRKYSHPYNEVVRLDSLRTLALLRWMNVSDECLLPICTQRSKAMKEKMIHSWLWGASLAQ